MPRALPTRRPYALAVALAAGSSVLAVGTALRLDLPLRDPDGVAGSAYVRLPLIVVAFFVADVVPRALLRARGLRSACRQLSVVVRERWTARRSLLVAVGLASFHATDVSYRNLKGALPFVRETTAGLGATTASASETFTTTVTTTGGAPEPAFESGHHGRCGTSGLVPAVAARGLSRGP